MRMANRLRLDVEQVLGTSQNERFYKLLGFLRTDPGPRQKRTGGG